MEENSADIECVQKAAVRVIMGQNHKDYETSLSDLHLEKLVKRRKELCLNFAKRTVSNTKMNHMFPVRREARIQKRRKTEFYVLRKLIQKDLSNHLFHTCKVC